MNIQNLKILIIVFLFSVSAISVAAPPDNVHGTLRFLGVTSDSSESVWLSETSAGEFKLEAQGQQLIDEWDKSAEGLHISFSPVVSQGSGGTHFLINRVNDRKLDSQNQQGGIVFPPFPSEPPEVMPPLFPENPIVIPPESTQPPNVTPPVQPPGNLSPGLPSTPSMPQANQRANLNQEAPITRARQFKQETHWNIWSDNRYFNLRDGRTGLGLHGITAAFTIGADRKVNACLVAGLLGSFIKYNNSALNGDLKNRASGFNVGPYFGYRISRQWATDGSVSFGELDNHNKVAVLNSEYQTKFYNATLRATGLYQVRDLQIRPKPLISFTHFHNPAYQFKGIFRNRMLKVNRAGENFNFGFAEFRLETNHSIQTKQGIIQPYIEAGVDYVFDQPKQSQILTTNLALVAVSRWTETLTTGIRALLAQSFFVDVSGSYLSFGQHGLDVWELRLLASYSFG